MEADIYASNIKQQVGKCLFAFSQRQDCACCSHAPPTSTNNKNTFCLFSVVFMSFHAMVYRYRYRVIIFLRLYLSVMYPNPNHNVVWIHLANAFSLFAYVFFLFLSKIKSDIVVACISIYFCSWKSSVHGCEKRILIGYSRVQRVPCF